MKKHSLFKIILIMLLLLVVASYVLVDRSGVITYIGLGDIVLNTLQSFYYFFDTALFILVVGGLYGVLNKTGAYKKLLDIIVAKVKPNSKKFLFGVVVIFALITALTGITLPLIIFIPFVVSIILLIGYDKLVAISSTIGAIVVGFIGGIFITFKDPSNYYGSTYTTFEKFVGLEDKFANLFPKIFLLFAAVALLVYYIYKHIKNVENKKVKYEITNDTDVLIAEVKGSYKNLKVWPLITILSLILVFLVLGLVPWNSLFGIEFFDNIHTAIGEFTIKDFAVFNSIISSNFPALGNWLTLGNYMMAIIMLLIFSLIIKIVYRIKFDDAIDGFVDGMKKMIPAALLSILACGVLVSAYNNGFIENIISKAGEYNVVTSSLITILGSLLNVDLYYTVAGVLSPFVSAFTDSSCFQVLAMSFQSFYGLVMLVGPTSLILIVGLTYLDVPYTTWLKYIWRLILELFILIFIVLFIVSLI